MLKLKRSNNVFKKNWYIKGAFPYRPIPWGLWGIFGKIPFHFARSGTDCVNSDFYESLTYFSFCVQEITYNMLCEMSLLDMCAQESLRLNPPAERYMQL